MACSARSASKIGQRLSMFKENLRWLLAMGPTPKELPKQLSWNLILGGRLGQRTLHFHNRFCVVVHLRHSLLPRSPFEALDSGSTSNRGVRCSTTIQDFSRPRALTDELQAQGLHMRAGSCGLSCETWRRIPFGRFTALEWASSCGGPFRSNVDTPRAGCGVRLGLEIGALVDAGLPRRCLAEGAQGSQGWSCWSISGEAWRLAVYLDFRSRRTED